MLNHIDAWQGSDYSTGFAYTNVINIPVLHKVLKRILHRKWLAGFQIFFGIWTCHGAKYAKVTQGSEQKASL